MAKVSAIDIELGCNVICEAEDAVEVDVLPTGDGNAVIPATLRWLRRGGDEGVPTRIRRIKLPTAKNGKHAAEVEFDCTPFIRWETEDGPVWGHWSGCYVRNMQDAHDPLFSSLSEHDRKRIARAAKISEYHRGLSVVAKEAHA